MNITINPKKSLNDITILAKDVVQRHNVAKSQVVAVFDVSGSMEQMYGSGLVKALATRVLAVGLQLDDNGIIPVYALGDNCKRLDDLTAHNLDNYVDSNLKNHVGGGTSYAPSIKKVVEDAEAGDPMLVLLFTDGENFDTADSEEALIKASKLPIFFQWYGIYEKGYKPTFSFLEEMDEMQGRQIDNAGFSPLGLNMAETDNDHDTTLFEDMVKEYKDFPNKAIQAGVKWENKTRGRFLGIF